LPGFLFQNTGLFVRKTPSFSDKRGVPMRLLALVAFLFATGSAGGALTPQQCDTLARWVYAQAEYRDEGVSRVEHEAAAREANIKQSRELVALLLRELGRLYDEGKDPFMAATDARFRCYASKGELGVEVGT
jgi:hypothetical protein